MDKQWMQCTDRLCNEYRTGVQNFLDFAFSHTNLGGVIPCPCMKCNNVFNKTKDEVHGHLLMHGIVKGYTRWLYHGEFIAKKKHVPNDLKTKEKDDIIGMIHDATGPSLMDAIMQDVCVQDTIEPNNPNNVEPDASPLVPNKKALKFLKLLEDAQQQLYPGCDEFSKLSFIVELFQIKCLYGISDKAVDCIM
ncbi:hypothetical protein Patl1_13788 [Pistacia atlantica]|uniref:Uncharacterized protein n=1 Tax=Pistacia atlantica TaxID=434234 RepID=A0ACC1AX27_9ROSI|nr:hypothetical protein Patl1_13788 [Pistacia atlantica]